MKKFYKNISLVLTVILAIGAMTACGGAPAQSQAPAPPASEASAEQPSNGGSDLDAALDGMKVVNLNWAISLGASHRANEMFQYFADEIKSRSKGKINITLYPGETLVKNSDIFESLINGVVDLGESDPSYSFSYFPLSSALFLSGINFANSVSATHTINEWYQSDYEELKKAKFLWAYGMSPSNLLTNKKIEKLEDFKGVQIRATGYAIDAVETLGASAVGITPAETYEALLKGTADAALMPAEALINWNFGEVVKFAGEIYGISTSNHYIAINWNVWNSFPEPVQQMIQEVSDECVDKIAPMWDEMGKDGIDFAVEKGAEYYVVPEEELQKWWDVLAPIQEKWVAEREGNGLPAQEALDRLKEMVDKYNEMYS